MSDSILRRCWLGFAGLGGLLLVALYVYAPQSAAEWVGRISPGCLFHRLTGLKCPGCGGTRALKAALQSDWAAAWGYNMFLWVSLALLAEETVRLALLERRGADGISRTGWYSALLRLYAVGAVLWFILRNVFGV